VSFQGDRARLGPLLAWLDRHVPGDACMRFLLDNAHAWAAAFDGDFARARARVLPYLDEAGPFAIVTQAGFIGLWSEDAPLVERAIAAADRNASAGAFATSVAWLRAIRPLLAGDAEEAGRLLADDPAPWLMVSASATFRLMASEMALAQGDDARATALLDDVEPRIADSAFHRYASLVHLLRAEVLRRRGEIRDAEGRAHAGLEIAAEHGLHVVTVEALETLALLADAVHDDAHAARLLGAVAAFRAGTGFSWRHPYKREALAALDARLAGAAFDEGRAPVARRRRRVRTPRARRAPPARHRLGRAHADRSEGRRARRRRPHEPRDRREALREPRDRQDPPDPRLHEARRAARAPSSHPRPRAAPSKGASHDHARSRHRSFPPCAIGRAEDDRLALHGVRLREALRRARRGRRDRPRAAHVRQRHDHVRQRPRRRLGEAREARRRRRHDHRCRLRDRP
jgi:hypothetical protein